ncbi:MAG: gamma-glutamylcyclotransferase family protein [Bacteroidota bacterium]
MISYFAYGANLNQAALPARGVKVIDIKKGILKDWQLNFGVPSEAIPGAGYASIEPAKGKEVEGAIIITDQASINNLDHYEGYPIDYIKEVVEVEEIETGEKIKCLVYIGNPKYGKQGLRPVKRYLEEILQGKEFFSDKYFNKLKKVKVI